KSHPGHLYPYMQVSVQRAAGQLRRCYGVSWIGYPFMQTTDVRQTRLGLLARRSPLLRLQSDERLIALIRSGNECAFEHLFERYRSRLLGFCRHMLGSKEDAEDVLQEVFVASYNAIQADKREINA